MLSFFSYWKTALRNFTAKVLPALEICELGPYFLHYPEFHCVASNKLRGEDIGLKHCDSEELLLALYSRYLDGAVAYLPET